MTPPQPFPWREGRPGDPSSLPPASGPLPLRGCLLDSALGEQAKNGGGGHSHDLGLTEGLGEPQRQARAGGRQGVL